MKRFVILAVCLGFLTVRAACGSREKEELQPPERVIGIIVENMRPDYLVRYRAKFSEEGFNRFLREGKVCTDVRMMHHLQNSASGTTTLLTGTDPSVHGIIGLSWYDRESGREVLCTADDREFLLGGQSQAAGGSPRRLLAPTLGDQLKNFTNGRSPVFSVAANESTALLASGYAGDGAYWFDNATGRMVSSSYYMKQLPGWVNQFNRREMAREYTKRNWVLLNDPSRYGESGPDNDPLEQGYGAGRNHFPHATAPLVKEAGHFGPLKTMPFINLLIREFAISLMDNEPTGTRDAPGLVTIAFSSMDYINNAFGPSSVEMEDLYLRLDQDIAALIAFAEKKFGRENLLFFLTSNVSASYPAHQLREKYRFPAGTFSPGSSTALLNSYLNITFGNLRWVSYSDNQQIYLDQSLIAINKVDLAEIESVTGAFFSQFEGIETVMTAREARSGMRFTHSSESIARSYHPQRSGDILYTFREGWHPAQEGKFPGYCAEPQIPLLFYGNNIGPGKITTPCDATQLVPTLSFLLEIPLSRNCNRNPIPGF